jgi:hypothetical protein
MQLSTLFSSCKQIHLHLTEWTNKENNLIGKEHYKNGELPLYRYSCDGILFLKRIDFRLLILEEEDAGKGGVQKTQSGQALLRNLRKQDLCAPGPLLVLKEEELLAKNAHG